MIWQSVWLMTTIDIVVLAIVGVALIDFLRKRRSLLALGGGMGIPAILFGLAVVALFYVADLLTMHVAPRIMPASEAMGVMQDLHLNFRWIVALIAVVAIATGLIVTNRGFRKFVATLETTEAELRHELTTRSALEDETRDRQISLANAQRIAKLGSWEWDVVSNAVWWSDEMYRISGIEPRDFGATHEAFLNIVHPDDRARVRQIVESAQNDIRPFDLDHRIVVPDGAIKFVHQQGEVAVDESGKPVRLSGTVQDVTERVEADSALRESEQRYRTLVDLTPEPVFVQSEGIVVFANQAAAEILGAGSTDRLVGMKPIDFLHPDSRESILTRRADIQAGRGPLGFKEHRYIRFDGAEVIVETASAPFIWYGHPANLIVARDITESRKVEREIAESEARLRGILESTADGIVTIDEHGTMETFSRSAEQIFGYSADEVVGRNVSLLMPEPDAGRHDTYVRNYLDTGNARIIGIGPREVDGLRKDGTHIAVDLAISEMTVGDRRIFIGSVRDISERKEQQAVLLQAQKMEVVGQLTGGVAHDFNNLLTSILGNLELLTERLADDPQLLSYAETAFGAGLRGAELTQRLLAFSRKQPLSPNAIDINHLVSGMMDLLRRTLGETVEIETVIGGGLWPAMIDTGQLETTLLNLAINARDAMPDGGKLTIETANAHLDREYAAARSEVTPGQYVMIAVTDTGTGMTQEIIKQVFEPFFTTKEIGKGTGLGLSMVYGFAKQSGGHAAIYSEPGVGTTVRLYLPRATSAQMVRQPTTTRQQVMPKGDETVLVVEDDPDVRGFVASSLSVLGYDVRECGDGPAAIALGAEIPHLDLLLTDVVLPGGINGRELAERIRKLFPGVKMIFTSGYTENAVVHQGRLDDGVELLAKPYRRETLAQRVREVLDGEG